MYKLALELLALATIEIENIAMKNTLYLLLAVLPISMFAQIPHSPLPWTNDLFWNYQGTKKATRWLLLDENDNERIKEREVSFDDWGVPISMVEFGPDGTTKSTEVEYEWNKNGTIASEHSTVYMDGRGRMMNELSYGYNDKGAIMEVLMISDRGASMKMVYNYQKNLPTSISMLNNQEITNDAGEVLGDGYVEVGRATLTRNEEYQIYIEEHLAVSDDGSTTPYSIDKVYFDVNGNITKVETFRNEELWKTKKYEYDSSGRIKYEVVEGSDGEMQRYLISYE